MFNSGDIVNVLIPNIVNDGYDYRLTESAKIGAYVRVSVMNRPYIGVIFGAGTSGMPPEKIKNIAEIYNFPEMSSHTRTWIKKMSEWTMMRAGAVLRLVINVPDAFISPQSVPLYTLNDDKKIRMTTARQAIADAFASNDNEPMSVLDIINIARATPGVINTMIKSGVLIHATNRIVAPNFKYEYKNTNSVVLNHEQKAAANNIAEHLFDNFSVHLLDGITGSGKTQVYFDSAWRVYESGKSVLIMMPEIALTTQFMTRFYNRFGNSAVVWHSNLTNARRREIWRGVANGDIKIIIGTRSALFLPWNNLGLIIIDEEHDGSYKQIDMGNYHARDMAIMLAAIAKFPVVLASATPAAETIQNVISGKYHIHKLTSRFGGAEVPKIETIDLRTNRPENYYTPADTEKPKSGNISPDLIRAIDDTINAGHQVMLFINRRGFAPIIQCTQCGWVAVCPDCSCGQTLHKKSGKLICHICGRATPAINICPDCGDELSHRGFGLEKIAEEINIKFPSAKTELVSSDTMMSRQAMERLVSRMESGEINIIIGTQILAKGHHFPGLTLVGVVDSDMGLFASDFRSSEHTFAQLFQVAGRAGRGSFPGRVLLQTYQPDHPVFDAICTGNRDKFMDDDMIGRRAAKMPPFGQLIAVIIEGTNESELHKFVAKLSSVAPKLIGGKIMGPINASVYQVRNWYRVRFLVSGDARANLQPIVRAWLNKLAVPKNIRVKIDVNPQNFM